MNNSEKLMQKLNNYVMDLACPENDRKALIIYANLLEKTQVCFNPPKSGSRLDHINLGIHRCNYPLIVTDFNPNWICSYTCKYYGDGVYLRNYNPKIDKPQVTSVKLPTNDIEAKLYPFVCEKLNNIFPLAISLAVNGFSGQEDVTISLENPDPTIDISIGLTGKCVVIVYCKY